MGDGKGSQDHGNMRDLTYCFYMQMLGLDWWMVMASAVHTFFIWISIDPTLLYVFYSAHVSELHQG